MPGKLKSMKITKKEAKKENESFVSDAPEFPFGLSINLHNESLEKLGIDTLPKVGDKMTLLAIVEVRGVSQHESISGDKRRNVDLQITEMALSSEVIDKSAGEKLYGDGKS